MTEQRKIIPQTEFRITPADPSKKSWAKGDKIEILSSFSSAEKEGCGLSSVEVVDWLGSDLTAVNAARVSFGKEKHEIDEADKKLLNFLQREGHWTPFSQIQLQLRIKMPIFVARQYFKHQVGLTRNEVSRRYVRNTPELWIPKYYRESAANVKQGSSKFIHPENDLIINTMYNASKDAVLLYEQALELGVCPEQARTILPQNTMTEFVETGSLAAYMRIVGLRDEATAQQEIQDFGKAIRIAITKLFESSCAAYETNV